MGCSLVCCSSDLQEEVNVASTGSSSGAVASAPLQQESDWTRLGGEELEQPLRDDLVKCVDSRYLVDLFHRGGRIERMQDLPDNAFIGLEDLMKLGTYQQELYEPTCTVYEWLPIAILSYSWLGRGHPDPHAETLEVLVKALEKLSPHGVIIDFTSLPQVPRTEDEGKRFKEGLQMFNIFYSHPHTLVLQVTDFPPGYPSAKSYDLPEGLVPAEYKDRGWCFAEACISSLGKTPKFLCNLSLLQRQAPSSKVQVVGACTNEHTPPPLSPIAFNEELAKKAFTQKKTDLARVQKLYEDAFKIRIRDAKTLMFAATHWGPAEIQTFAQVIEVNECVHHLDLSENQFGEEGVKTLLQVMERHRTLKSVKIERCGLRKAEARVVGEALKGKAPLFGKLDIGMNEIRDEGVTSLAEGLKLNTSLTDLDLASSKIGAAGAQALAEALKINCALTKLNLLYNPIKDRGAQAMAEALKINSSLSEVCFEDCQIWAEGMLSLGEALKVNTTLTTLNLTHNLNNDRIGVEGARSLAEALKLNTGLTTLNLCNNLIGPKGTRSLAEALKVNTTITSLNLAQNRILAEGAQCLAEALKVNTTLTTLNLFTNMIGPLGARSLAEALKLNSTLKVLSLKFNGVVALGAQALVEALKVNTALTELNLQVNGIGEEDAQSVTEAARPGCRVVC